MALTNPFTGEPIGETPDDKVISAAISEINKAVATIKAEQEENLETGGVDALDELGQLIAEREAKMHEIEALKETFEEAEKEDESELEALQIQLNAIRQRQRERNAEKLAKRQEWLRLKQEIDEKSKQRRDFLAKQEMELKQKAEYDFYLHNVAVEAKWRTRARAHQMEGAIRLAISKRAICGDKPGLGKTLQSIMYMDFVGAKKILVVAPADTLSNYEKEIKNWAPHRIVRVMGGMNKLQRDMWFMALQTLDQFVLIINYEAWRKDYADVIGAITRLQLDTIICDEAHMMAEGKTLAFKGVRELVYAENVCEQCDSYAEVKKTKGIRSNYLQCTVCHETYMDFPSYGKISENRRSVKNVLPMTGTSIRSKPQNMWTLLNLMDRDEFPDLNSYLDRFCYQDFVERAVLTDHGVESKRVGIWKFVPGGQDRLIKRIGTNRIVSRSPESAGVEMPPQDIRHHYLTFDGQYKKQREVMNWIRKFFIKIGDDAGVEFKAPITRLLRMRQALTWPGGIHFRDKDTKQIIWQADAQESIILDKAMQLAVDAVDSDNRVLIFSQFKEPLKELEQRFIELGISVCRYDGDTPDAIREQIKADVDSKAKIDNPEIMFPRSEEHPNGFKNWVVLANYKTGGTGLNIDLCRETIFLDREWTPAGEDQAMARTARMNTEWGSIVHMLHVENTVSDVMDSIIEIKREIVNGYESEVDMVEMLNKALRQEY